VFSELLTVEPGPEPWLEQPASEAVATARPRRIAFEITDLIVMTS